MIQTVNCWLNSGAFDPDISSVKLLMGFEGSDGSTTFTDESPAAHGNAIFANQAQIDTAQFKFGASSLLLDGNNDQISFTDHADWSFGSGEFTVEAWVRFNSIVPVQTVVAHWRDNNNLREWLLDYRGSTETDLRFGYTTTGADQTFIQGNWAPSANTWYHVAADRDSGGTLRIYADGVMIASGSANVTFFNSTDELRIGIIHNGTNDFNGWMDELRITKGVARYASDSGYTVPTAAFPRS